MRCSGRQPVGEFGSEVVSDTGHTTTGVSAIAAPRTMTARAIRATLNACEHQVALPW